MDSAGNQVGGREGRLHTEIPIHNALHRNHNASHSSPGLNRGEGRDCGEWVLHRETAWRGPRKALLGRECAGKRTLLPFA